MSNVSYALASCTAEQVEKYYTWEVKKLGEASANTKALRSYWLHKLLEQQLREFDRD